MLKQNRVERHLFGDIGEAIAAGEQPKFYRRGVEANEAFAKAMCAAHPDRALGTIKSPGMGRVRHERAHVSRVGSVR
jgi:hypothetical protein